MVTAPSASKLRSGRGRIVYPQSDGKPMADNTLQWEWIVFIKNGIQAVFEDRSDVFIASDLLWYPVEGEPKICAAPDVMVAIGRPRGYRGSYLQWKEDNLPFQVVFEILSPKNTRREMERKHGFYQQYGALEYYLYDPGIPDRPSCPTSLRGWRRENAAEDFVEIEPMDGWRSPHLGITFRYAPRGELRLFGPDGKSFESQKEVIHRAEENARRAEENARLAELSNQRMQRLLAQLRAAGIEPADE